MLEEVVLVFYWCFYISNWSTPYVLAPRPKIDVQFYLSNLEKSRVFYYIFLSALSMNDSQIYIFQVSLKRLV